MTKKFKMLLISFTIVVNVIKNGDFNDINIDM